MNYKWAKFKLSKYLLQIHATNPVALASSAVVPSPTGQSTPVSSVLASVVNSNPTAVTLSSGERAVDDGYLTPRSSVVVLRNGSAINKGPVASTPITHDVKNSNKERNLGCLNGTIPINNKFLDALETTRTRKFVRENRIDRLSENSVLTDPCARNSSMSTDVSFISDSTSTSDTELDSVPCSSPASSTLKRSSLRRKSTPTSGFLRKFSFSNGCFSARASYQDKRKTNSALASPTFENSFMGLAHSKSESNNNDNTLLDNRSNLPVDFITPESPTNVSFKFNLSETEGSEHYVTPVSNRSFERIVDADRSMQTVEAVPYESSERNSLSPLISPSNTPVHTTNSDASFSVTPSQPRTSKTFNSYVNQSIIESELSKGICISSFPKENNLKSIANQNIVYSNKSNLKVSNSFDSLLNRNSDGYVNMSAKKTLENVRPKSGSFHNILDLPNNGEQGYEIMSPKKTK